MKCPIERGGCGAELRWFDGAFCKDCMQRASVTLENRMFECEDCDDTSPEVEYVQCCGCGKYLCLLCVAASTKEGKDFCTACSEHVKT